MRNLLPQREKYLMNFANSVYDEYRKQKFGIQSCKPGGKLWLDELRKDIANYQYNDDGGAFCQVSIQTMAWLPVYYPTTDDTCEYMPPWCDMSKYQIQRCSAPTSVGMSYTSQNAGANIIEVNAGGCITRINVNPSIVINNNTGTGFTYAQNCSDPQTVWTIVHNLGYTPNVWVEDCNGCNADGIINVVNANTITITFSEPIGGIAHLS